MKKRYISPITKVVKIDGAVILAGSVGFGDGETYSGDARRHNFDFDEDDY